MKAVSYLGIGSNMGNRHRNIQQAIRALRRAGISVKKISPIIETEPVGGPPQQKFLNAAIKVETILQPHQLLTILKSIERKLGRRRTVRNGPRPVDLDILLYADEIIKTRRLTVPHPRMCKRDFVMKPLSQIAPGALRELKCS